jgi:O-antigen/teichoic acid export membrane protein
VLSPVDLGNYFFWLAVSSVLVVLANARLDTAIFNARSEEEVLNLLRLIIVCAAAMTAAFVVLASANTVDGELFAGAELIQRHSISLGLFTFATAVHGSLLAVMVYRAQFTSLSWAKVLVAGVLAGLQLIVSLAGSGGAGLMWAHLATTLLAIVLAIHWTNTRPKELAQDFSWAGIWGALRSNYRFPLIAMPAGLINTLALQLPLFLVVSRFGMTAMAFYALTVRAMSAPISLVANSVLTVYKQQAARDFREKGNCVDAYQQALKTLSMLAIVPFVIVILFGEALFRLVFGASWAPAGRFAEILAPLFFLKFVASPLGYTFFIANRQAHDLFWQIGLLVMTWASFGLAPTIEDAVKAYSFGYSLMYLVYLGLSYRSARGVGAA